MSESPQTPETPRQRLSKEYEDPHYHDDDDVDAAEDDTPRSHGKRPPRFKPVYRPQRRFEED
jgi:hypothetical protein